MLMALFILVQVNDVIYWLAKTRNRGHFKAREFAAAAQDFYREQTGKDIPLAFGDMWYAGCIMHYLPEHPYAGSYEDPYDEFRFRSILDEEGAIGVYHQDKDVAQLAEALTSKRYTQATVRRALTHLLIGAEWDEVNRLTAKPPSAVRLLSAKETGRQFVREYDQERIRIVTNRNKEEEQLSAAGRELLDLDEKAADLYNLLRGRDIRESSDRVMRPYIG
jgi:hypothetical protein